MFQILHFYFYGKPATKFRIISGSACNYVYRYMFVSRLRNDLLNRNKNQEKHKKIKIISRAAANL